MPDDRVRPTKAMHASARTGTADRIVVIGAGAGGLAAAIALAARGLRVTVLERQAAPGGKMRRVPVSPDATCDGGPTVFTMRWVFEELFAETGRRFADHVGLRPAQILARHAWSRDERLDLFADIDRSRDAIADFASPAEGDRYMRFCARAAALFQGLKQPFMTNQKPTPFSLATRTVAAHGLRGLAGMAAIAPWATVWAELGKHFTDPRLRQLFGRYATYCGASPFAATATLMLVAHVEQDGVWLVDGGMHALARAMAGLSTNLGAEIRYEADVAEIVVENGRATGAVLSSGERLPADAVVFNGDCSAIGSGLLGRAAAHAVAAVKPAQRSLSALVWCALAEPRDFPLIRHNVFFSSDYRREFDEIFSDRRLPTEPTTYICAQDRDDGPHNVDGPERLSILVNAPADGDTIPFDDAEIEACKIRTLALLDRCGLTLGLPPETTVTTGPAAFDRLFPATGGALYGRAAHGAMASFRRPGARSRLPRLYLAGGSVHPGPGVPMATLSGRLAAAQLLMDRASMWR